jgi:hypothetical protein
MMTRLLTLFACASLLSAQTATGPDQTKPGAGNAQAGAIASASPMVQSAWQFLMREANRIQDDSTRYLTQDAIGNPNTCIVSRANLTTAQKSAILQTLMTQGLINPADAASINGGAMAGVFPPVLNDGTACPTLPMAWYAAPGSAFGGHHSYPGGLPVHENANLVHSMGFADDYRNVYGQSASGSPITAPGDNNGRNPEADIYISQDLIVASPIWHDWAKPIVFQWAADGTEFIELNFGGNGTTDAWGQAGDSRTGAHHIITIGEMMARGLSPEFVITMACAHNTPTSGGEYKVVNWLRAGAILAQIDPVAKGYLFKDTAGNLRLPPLRALGSIDLLQGSSQAHTNTLIEYVIHNLSDSDFTLTGPAVTEVQSVLANVASQFGANPTDTANYNTKFRNPVLSNLTAERLLTLYGNGGTGAVANAINQIKANLGK